MRAAPRAQSFPVRVKTWEAQWGHRLPGAWLHHRMTGRWAQGRQTAVRKRSSPINLRAFTALYVHVPGWRQSLLPARVAFEWWNAEKKKKRANGGPISFGHWHKQLWTLRTLAAITRGASSALDPCNFFGLVTGQKQQFKSGGHQHGQQDTRRPPRTTWPVLKIAQLCLKSQLHLCIFKNENAFQIK